MSLIVLVVRLSVGLLASSPSLSLCPVLSPGLATSVSASESSINYCYRFQCFGDQASVYYSGSYAETYFFPINCWVVLQFF